MLLVHHAFGVGHQAMEIAGQLAVPGEWIAVIGVHLDTPVVLEVQ